MPTFGIVDGLGVGAIIRVVSGTESEGRIVYACGLAGEVTGTYWGKNRVRDWDCTEGPVVVDRTGGILGMGVPTALYYAFSNFAPGGDANTSWVSFPASAATSAACIWRNGKRETCPSQPVTAIL